MVVPHCPRDHHNGNGRTRLPSSRRWLGRRPIAHAPNLHVESNLTHGQATDRVRPQNLGAILRHAASECQHETGQPDEQGTESDDAAHNHPYHPYLDQVPGLRIEVVQRLAPPSFWPMHRASDEAASGARGCYNVLRWSTRDYDVRCGVYKMFHFAPGGERVSNDPRAELSAALRHLHRHAGEPSTRDIARAIAYSHTTVAQALSGSRRCSWKVLEKIVLHLKGDLDSFKHLWLLARSAEDPLPPLADSQGPPAHVRPTAVVPPPAGDQHPPSSYQVDERVEIIWDQATQTPRFLAPPSVALQLIRDLQGEGSSDDEG
jgi:hypothetical protein